ncbi:MAG: hypothetical protein ACLFUP_03080 [Desulfobacteraceae bacterium]
MRGVRGSLKRKLAAVVVFAVLLGACAAPDRGLYEQGPEAFAIEHEVVPIPLAGEITRREAEISGLAWCGDDLVLLPQYPERFSFSDQGVLFVIPRDKILSYLAGQTREAIKPGRVPLVAPGLSRRIPGWEGFEAIAFDGGKVYLTIEARSGGGMTSYLVTGRVASQGRALVLDTESLVEVRSGPDIPNMGEEALLVCKDRILSIYEANGMEINREPTARVFDRRGRPQGELPLTHLEYRITDATDADAEGRFWVMNFFFPGDKSKLRPARDRLRRLHGIGKTHSRREAVERIVELRIRGSRVELTERPPVQMELAVDRRPRNWEGLVKLAPHGFLAATDKYPSTILAFIPAEL